MSYQTFPIRLFGFFLFSRLRARLIGSLAAGSKLFLLSDLYSTLIITSSSLLLLLLHPFPPPLLSPFSQLLPFQQPLQTSSPLPISHSLAHLFLPRSSSILACPTLKHGETQLGPTSTHASCGLTYGLYVAYSSHSASPNLYLSPTRPSRPRCKMDTSPLVHFHHVAAGSS